MTTHLMALATAKPDDARRSILEAIDACKGNRQAAARLLGEKPMTFYRCIERLHLWGAIDDLIDRKGYRARSGRPRKKAASADLCLSAKRGQSAPHARRTQNPRGRIRAAK